MQLRTDARCARIRTTASSILVADCEFSRGACGTIVARGRNIPKPCWSYPTSLTPRKSNDERDPLSRTFDEQTRLSLMNDDAAAWRAVCGVLITVVSLGLSIGILAVLLA